MDRSSAFDEDECGAWQHRVAEPWTTPEFCRCWPGATVWLTGLPSSGKTTIARGVAQELHARGRRTEILDGDENRKLLSAGLGFGKEDRLTNVRRVGLMSEVLARNGILVLVPVIAPYAVARAEVRERHTASATAFLEVHVDAPLEVCRQRDVKGLYARQAAGRLSGLTGVDDPYEPPLTPELRIETHRLNVDESVDSLLLALAERGLA